MKRVEIVDWQASDDSSPIRFLFEGAGHGASMSFYVTDFPPGRGPRLHRHPYEEVFLIQEGVARFNVAGETIDVGAGQVIVVPAEAPHTFINAGEGRLLTVDIHGNPGFIQVNLEE